MEVLEIFMVAAMAQCCCRSARENDLQEERIRSEGEDGYAPEATPFLGWRGGSNDNDEDDGIEFELEPESSLVMLLLLSELFMATAKARVLLLKLIGLLQMPPPLNRRG